MARWQRLLVLIPIAIALPILIQQAFYFILYLSDDSLIVARYAERLIEGHGLTWTDGERVEGYSNLLWTVSVAAIGALGIDLVDAMRLLGVTCMASVFVSLSWANLPRSLPEVVTPTVAASLFAVAGPTGVWAVGGLEASMVAALLGWALVMVFPIVDGRDARDEEEPQSARRALLVGIPLALLCWTRPDGPLFTAVFAGVTVLLFRLRRTGFLLALRMTVLPVVAVAMQLCFRLIYYGDWLPNPAYIKARVARERIPEGIDYVVGGWEWMVPALVLATLSLIVSFTCKHQRGRSILLLCCFFAWASYVIAIGGDTFHGRRHLVPLWLLLAFMVAPGLDWVVRRQRVWLTLAVALASLAAVGWLHKLQRQDPRIQQAKIQIWQWEGEVLAVVLGQGFRAEQPLMAVTAAGTFPYYSKLPSLDMLGLNDRHIARQRPERPGDLAHDHADGGYVLDREPDLIVFSLGIRAGFDVGREMMLDERFKRDYMAAVFRGHVPHERDGIVYVRLHGRVGIQVEDDLVTVPGYLLEGKGVYAQLGVEQGIQTVIPVRAKLASRPVPLGQGTWRVTVEPPNPNVDVGLYIGKGQPAKVLSVTRKDGPVRVRVTSRETSSLLGTIRIERVTNEQLAKSQATVVGPTNYEVEPFGTFEDGFGAWRVGGRAFGKAPATKNVGRQGPIHGHVGKFLNSHAPKSGDRAKGRLTSEPFTVTEGMVLGFRIGGGKEAKVGVRLMEGDRTMMVWHGDNSETLAEIRFALTSYTGRTLHIEVFDESSIGWGHVVADEFVLLHPTAAEPVHG